MKDILNRLKGIFAQHTKGGFQINKYHAENELKNIEADMIPSTLHIQAAVEH